MRRIEFRVLPRFRGTLRNLPPDPLLSASVQTHEGEILLRLVRGRILRSGSVLKGDRFRHSGRKIQSPADPRVPEDQAVVRPIEETVLKRSFLHFDPPITNEWSTLTVTVFP